jgi:hypothetical protein
MLSTATGDMWHMWLLDRSDHLAARLARDGESEPVHIEDTDTALSVGRVAIVSTGRRSFTRIRRAVITILGYPADKLADTA